MAKMFEVGKDVKLTREQKMLIKSWQKKWPVASDEERQQMQDEFAQMVRSANVEEIWKSQGSSIGASTSEEAAVVAAAVQQAEEESQEGEENPLKGRPHALYCGGAELMAIVEIDRDVWGDYATFLTKYPDKTIFDINPSKVAVAFVNQKLYNALITNGDAFDQNEVNKCIQRLPEEFAPFELSFLEALLCMEADCDPRIKKLGYKGENMKEYKDSGLFKAYFTGEIFKTLHDKAKDQKSENSGKGKEGKGNGQNSSQGKGSSQKSNQGKGDGKTGGNGSFKVKRVGNGQSPKGKPGSKPTGGKPTGSKGSIRSGKHDQTAAALFL